MERLYIRDRRGASNNAPRAGKVDSYDLRVLLEGVVFEMSSDQDFMAMALDLARLGLGRTSPNPAVGAVIVKDGRVIATGFHKRAGMPHAEVEALRQGSGQANGATLYVTLEPCCHYGRTPPCTDAIIKGGIREVVVGMRDPDPKVSGRGIRVLKRHGIRVREGVLKRECEQLNEAYLKHRKTGMPFVTLKVAATRDGMVGAIGGGPRWVSGPEARAYGHEMRDRADGILVGINTIVRDDPRLTTRLKGRRGDDPVRIILDSFLRIRPTARVLRVRSRSPTWIATTAKPTDRKVYRLKKRGVEILSCRPVRNGRVDLRDLLKQLGNRGIVTLLVEGGPTVWASFLRRRLADKMVLFIGARVAPSAGKAGRSLPLNAPSGLVSFHMAPSTLGKNGIPWTRKMPALRRVTCRRVGPDLMIEGYL